MGKFCDLIGTLATSFQLGKGGARIRSNSGTIEARNAANSTLAPFAASQVRASSVSSIPVRQTVLAGSVDASGYPNALSAGSGLSVSLAASTTAFTIAFAAGFDVYGAVDFVGQLTSNQTFSGLTASTTNYLYVDRNVSTGALTLGFSVLVPVYSWTAPSAPATDQHWFNPSPTNFQMQRWNGSAWVAVQRVFIGETVTGTSSITSVTTYAYQRRYQSEWFSVSSNTGYTKNHNVGIPLPALEASIDIFSGVTASDTNSSQSLRLYYAGSMVLMGYGWIPRNALVANTRNSYGIYVADFPLLNNSGLGASSGFYKLVIRGGW